MLVLTRKAGEQVLVAGNVSVTVLEIRGGCVRLGFDAPGDVPIRRRELPLRTHIPSHPPTAPDYVRQS